MHEDAQLLRRYVEQNSDDAFAALVRRHISLVYAVALRQVGGDVHLAEDVVQQVFTALARKAPTLLDRAALSGWLYRSTHFTASDCVRNERRRRRRETEVLTMQEIDAKGDGDGVVDWQTLRPVLDGAIANLDERDRDAVSLRFFEGCTFAEIGERLRLTENAARMRVDRALDKLHALLGRRGIKSTAGALAIALGNQVSAAPPAALAASVTGAALASAVMTGTAGTGAGIFALSTSKTVAAVATIAAIIAVGFGLTENRQSRRAKSDLARAEQQQRVVETQVRDLNTRLRQAERRAGEAEKDNSDLLKAVEDLRLQQTRSSKAVPTRVERDGRTADDERLALARAYQQELANHRVEEAKGRARIDEEASRLDAVAQFERLIAAAEDYLAKAEFQMAIRTFNRALQLKPADLPVSDRVKTLQAALMAQNVTTDLQLISDGETWVSITNYRTPSKFTNSTVKMLPGNYQVLGRRKGFRDVEMVLKVRAGVPLAPLTIVCTVSI
jgi:RNA polymerase sigma factor (sigma-70 family)